MSARAAQEYMQAIYPRERAARRPETGRLQEEVCRVTGYHRKHAIRVRDGPLRDGGPRRPPAT